MTQPRKKEGIAGRIVALVIFGLLVAASITLYFGASRFIQDRTSTKFEYDTQATTTQMSGQITQYASLLYNGRSILTLKPGITNSEWQEFFENQGALSRNKGVSSIIYLTYAKGVTSAQYSAMINEQADTSLAISLRPAGERSEYASTSLVASSHKLDYLLGGDMMSEPLRRAALDASIETQVPQATPPLKLKSGVDGFLMALPHQDANDNLHGFTVLSFRSHDLIEELLSSNSNSPNVRVVDVTDSKNPSEVYKSAKWSDDGYTRSDRLSVGGRTWQVTYSASVAKYQDDIMRAVPVLFLMLGLICSFMMFIMILIIFRVPISLFGRSL